MTVPRRLVPGQTHSATRRTNDRELLLLPTEEACEIEFFGLARAIAKNQGVKVYGYMANTTHDHIVLADQSDPGEHSQLPSFMMMKNSLTARALNAHYGRGGAVWRGGSYDNVELHDVASFERGYVYAILNVVKDGLVERPEDWPGPKILPEDIGRTITVQRPKGAFFGGRRPANYAPTDPDALAEWEEALRKEDQDALQRARDRDRLRGLTTKRQRQLEATRRRQRAKAREAERLRPRRNRSTLPEFVEFTVPRPPGYDHLTDDELRAHLRRLLDAAVAKVHAEFAAAGRGFMGLEKLLDQSPRKRLGEPFPRFKLNPRVACTGRKRRALVLRGLEAWREDVAMKRARWRDGHRDVVFPQGLYGLWRFHGARVEGARGPPKASPPS